MDLESERDGEREANKREGWRERGMKRGRRMRERDGERDVKCKTNMPLTHASSQLSWLLFQRPTMHWGIPATTVQSARSRWAHRPHFLINTDICSLRFSVRTQPPVLALSRCVCVCV